MVDLVIFGEFISNNQGSLDIQVKYVLELNIKKCFHRGAPLTHAERKKLNLEAGELIKSLGIEIDVTENYYDKLREDGYVGYANYYLQQCYDEYDLINKADVKIYNQLIEIDLRLGTTQTEQLDGCVFFSVRMDLIKVLVIFRLNVKFNYFR